MRRALFSGVIIALLVAGVSAQSILPPQPPLPPPLNDRLPPPMNAPGPDLFRATPDTYAPRFDHPVPPPSPAGSVVYGPWGPWPQWSQPVIVSPTVVVHVPPTESRPAPVPPAPAAAVAPPRAQPKTFYVIPGCYAGDRRPERGRLPRGCSLAKLRTIPPVVNRHF